MAISDLERKCVDGTYGLSLLVFFCVRVIFLTDKVAEKSSAGRNCNSLHVAFTRISQPTFTCFLLSQLLQKGPVFSFASSDDNSGIPNLYRSWARRLPSPGLHLSFSLAVTLHSGVESYQTHWTNTESKVNWGNSAMEDKDDKKHRTVLPFMKVINAYYILGISLCLK